MTLLGKIINRIKRPVFYKGREKWDLIIFDDFFPNPVTGFRIAEFSALLNHFRSIKVLIQPTSYKHLGLEKEDFNIHFNKFILENLPFRNRLKKVKKFNNINCSLCYFVFLNNGRQIVSYLNANKINFVFTLYPGGGFKMDDRDSDNDLKSIMGFPFFKGVIVTQQCTMDYLLEKNFCSKDKITCVPGIPMLDSKLQFEISNKKYYSDEKNRVDICFVAAKYSATGIDKGYDLFIAAAIVLFKINKAIKFHVIGGFSEKEIDVSQLGKAIHFYGYLDADVLPKTLQKFDIIVSPNRPNILGAGSFDGFPLGACVEAALAGCVIIATDELGQNFFYKDGDEIIIIKPLLEELITALQTLIDNPEKLKKIGISGMNKTKQLYSYNNQIVPRIALLEKAIGGN